MKDLKNFANNLASRKPYKCQNSDFRDFNKFLIVVPMSNDDEDVQMYFGNILSRVRNLQTKAFRHCDTYMTEKAKHYGITPV